MQHFIPRNESRTTTERMNRLPCELLHHIFLYMDQSFDLLRLSCVCSHWRSLIMDDEYFLNQWFSQSLERCRQPVLKTFLQYIEGFGEKSMLHIDQSLFPINLRSSECWLLPWSISRHSSDLEDLIVHVYPVSLFKSSHSFSFWLFVPHQCKLDIQIGNFNTNGLIISLYGNENDYFDNGKCLSIADQWIHIVLTKIDSQSNYRIWIDGQYVSKFSKHRICSNEKMSIHSLNYNIIFLHLSDNNSLGASSKARIADFNAFKRCLTLVEIRAIHQQQTSIKQVKVGNYINGNKIHNHQGQPMLQI